MLLVACALLIAGRIFFYSPCDATYMSGSYRCECQGVKIDVTDIAKAAMDAAPGGETRCIGIVKSRIGPDKFLNAPTPAEGH